ncbi:MAG: Rieske 2Fe-2S domain-containing protein [Pseudomonadota bacterium]
MSVKYIPVQWNPNKWKYNAVMLASIFAYLWIFLEWVPGQLDHEGRINGAIHNARAFGSCAFFMLTVILCIGPLARLDQRFLPLLYNRRHFGVMTSAVALTHAFYIMGWYYAFSPSNQYEALLFSNTSYGQLVGFPFEVFGIFALLCLLILAATSHDFWLKFLTPRIWKGIHYLVYAAYISVIAHLSFGILQDQQDNVFPALFIASGLGVSALHIMAAIKERAFDKGAIDTDSSKWVRVCEVTDMEDGFAKVTKLGNKERVAVYLMEGKLSAISNACAHQNGPLGEGKIIDCLVTCPWHGFQYDVRDGRSPAPFTEMVPTYKLKLKGGTVYVDPDANPPGTYVEPIEVPTKKETS